MSVRPVILEMSCSNERMAGLGENAVCTKTRPSSLAKQSAEGRGQEPVHKENRHENLPLTQRK